MRFLQDAVPNRPAKQRFLAAYEPSHAIAYCQAEEGLALELTRHSSPLCDAPSPYQVLGRTCGWPDAGRLVAFCWSTSKPQSVPGIPFGK